MKCVLPIEGSSVISRVSEEEATQLVRRNKTHKFVPKAGWKAQERAGESETAKALRVQRNAPKKAPVVTA